MSSELLSIEADFAGAEFGDKRLDARLIVLGAALFARPDQPLPDVLLDEAGLEAGYRFLNNEKVTASAILKPHIAATVSRCEGAKRLLVLHDTTSFCFSNRGFGPLRGHVAGDGFFAHVALAVDGRGPRSPLGVMGVRTFERLARPKGQRKSQKERREDSELKHWGALVSEVEESLGDMRAVHVMDRQADAYSLFGDMIGKDFVIRGTHDRVAGSNGKRVQKIVRGKPVRFKRKVVVSARSGPGWNRNRHQPTRDARNANLSVRATSIHLPRPKNAHSAPQTTTPDQIQLNVVQVDEVRTPRGEQPIEWMLWTSLPIDTAEQIEEIVEIYRQRWLIEELFKAVKTGCAYEKRRFETPHPLLNLLAVTLPVAYRLLLLRHLSRTSPDVPAEHVLTSSQIAVLKATPRAKLAETPNARDALHAVARLGGHLRNNGDPGWQILTRGYHELLVLEEGWLAAANYAKRCVES